MPLPGGTLLAPEAVMLARDAAPAQRADRDTHAAMAVEPRIRRIVADRLGLSPAELLMDTSLADDLAVDSLDLLEIAIAIETEVGVSIAERSLESVRTYGDLVTLVAPLAVESRHPIAGRVLAVVTRVVVADRATVERSALLTPYAVETIADDAIAAGPGARLEVELRGEAGTRALERVRVLFARLGPRGIRVQVNAHPELRAAGRRPAA
jgi:acyl carrier protein